MAGAGTLPELEHLGYLGSFKETAHHTHTLVKHYNIKHSQIQMREVGNANLAAREHLPTLQVHTVGAAGEETGRGVMTIPK